MTVQIYPGDNRAWLAALKAQGVQFQSVVCDPPYGLTSIKKRFGSQRAAPAKHGTDGAFARASRGFMGKEWDGTGIENDPTFWRAVFDVMLPGAYCFAFSGTRTVHRQMVAMEDAGFILHPLHIWAFGCLDERTMVATPDGEKAHTELSEGDLVLCYDADNGEYSYQPVQEIVEYEYDDTAYRLIGDFGEQVVSRNHRCIVERDGREVFEYAETLASEARVPVLESLPDLQSALCDSGHKGRAPQDVQPRMQEGRSMGEPGPNADSAERAEGSVYQVRGVRKGSVEAERLASQGGNADVQQPLQREATQSGIEETCAQGARRLDRRTEPSVLGSLEGCEQSVMERRGDVQEPQRSLSSPADQIRPVSGGIFDNGATRRVRDGAPFEGGESDQSLADTCGDCSSYQSRRDGQSTRKSDVVRDKRRAQGVRAWSGHKSAMVRVVPFHKTGRVWCLRVPTGAFVAVRDGVAFPTGNSGFPKAHAADKAIDKAGGDPDEAQRWAGWAYGTQAQKPALEPIVLAQKPFSEKTGAANILKHGVGAVNIDGCRVGTETIKQHGRNANDKPAQMPQNEYKPDRSWTGRHPANLIHDGSDEVRALFPNGKSGKPGVRRKDHDTHSMSGRLGTTGQSEVGYADEGSAARFFHAFPADEQGVYYHPKASKADRAGSKHPTVKPVALMQHLIRHITPPGGTVLDPFAGSGTTGEAARREGFDCALMEREPEYLEFLYERFKP